MLLPSVRETGSLEFMVEMQSKLVWRLLSENDKAYRPTLAEFSKGQRPLRLDAFEHYIRGLLANDDEPRLRELRDSSSPRAAWPGHLLCARQTYFTRKRLHHRAFLSFPHSARSRSHLEALFSTGVCRLQLNQPDRAKMSSFSAEFFDRQLQANRQAGALGADLPGIPEQPRGSHWPVVGQNCRGTS